MIGEDYVVYYLIMAWNILTWFFVQFIQQGIRRKVYFYLNYGLFFFVSAFRTRYVGSDTETYCYAYTQAGNMGIDDINGIFASLGGMHFEVGYVLFNKLFYSLSDNPQLFIIASSAVVVWGIGYFFYENSSNICISTVLFMGLALFLFTFTPIRQSMAMVFLLWAVKNMWLDRKTMAFCFILLAATFHVSSFTFLPLLLLMPPTNEKVTCFVLIVACLCSVVYVAGFDRVVNALFSADIYTSYLVGEMSVEHGSVGVNMIKAIICALPALAGYMLVRFDIVEVGTLERDKVIFLSIITFCTACLSVMTHSLSFIGRLIPSWYVFICLLAPLVYDKWRSISKFATYPLIIMCLLVYLTSWIARETRPELLIYTNVFFD